MTTEPTVVSAPIEGTDKSLTFETGKLAQQSQGAVVVSIGGTKSLVTANGASKAREGMDFFPLTIDVEERMYAAGRIPGSFFRREGRPTDLAILTCRLTDRPLRPSFPDGFRHETQVVSTILGADGKNPYDIITINGASAALMLSGLPFDGPVGAVRMAFDTDGEWVAHPEHDEIEESTFDLVVAGRENAQGEIAIMMVEANGTERAWEHYQNGAPFVTEEAIAQGLEESKKSIKQSIDAQRELVEAYGARPPLEWSASADYEDDVLAKVQEVGTDRLREVGSIAIKAEREQAERDLKDAIRAELADEFPGREKEIGGAIKATLKKVIRERIVNDGVRIDGRGPSTHFATASRQPTIWPHCGEFATLASTQLTLPPCPPSAAAAVRAHRCRNKGSSEARHRSADLPRRNALWRSFAVHSNFGFQTAASAAASLFMHSGRPLLSFDSYPGMQRLTD